MNFKIEDLLQPWDIDELKQRMYDALEIVGVETTAWGAANPYRVWVNIASVAIASVSELIVEIAKSGFMLEAQGDWADVVGEGFYGESRVAATNAEGSVDLVNGSGGVFNLGAREVIFKNATTDKTYTNTSAISLGALATLTDVPVVAVEAGADSSALPGEITELVTTLTGVTVNNPLALVGLDEETTAAYASRAISKIDSVSPNGPREAYSFQGPKAVRADGSSIGVTRIQAVSGGNCSVDVYAATATGGVSGVQSDNTTDLGALHDHLYETAVPLSVVLSTNPAVNRDITVAYSIWVDQTKNYTLAEIYDLASNAVAAAMSQLPIGGYKDPITGVGKFYRKTVEEAICQAVPGTINLLVTSPPFETNIAVGEIPVLDSITQQGVLFVDPQ